MHIKSLPMGLSDHTPILIQFVPTPRQKSHFQYCEWWSKQPRFHQIVFNNLSSFPHISLEGLYEFLDQIRYHLQKLNSHKFADLRGQELKARQELESVQTQLQQPPEDPNLLAKERATKVLYASILESSLSLIKQQCKQEWLSLGDENTRCFFAKAKQRKLATYIYSLQDTSGAMVEGFDAVGQVMFDYYKQKLGPQHISRKRIDQEVINQGATLSMVQQIHLCKDFTD